MVFHTNLMSGFYRAFPKIISFILISNKHQIIPLHGGTPFYHTLSTVSITPHHYNNPGFWVYEAVECKVDNYRQWFTDIRPKSTELSGSLNNISTHSIYRTM